MEKKKKPLSKPEDFFGKVVPENSIQGDEEEGSREETEDSSKDNQFRLCH